MKKQPAYEALLQTPPCAAFCFECNGEQGCGHAHRTQRFLPKGMEQDLYIYHRFGTLKGSVYMRKQEAVKNLNQLWIIEADDLKPLRAAYEPLLASFSITPPQVRTFDQLTNAVVETSPELVLFHSYLTTLTHLERFIRVHSLFPYSSIVIVSNEQNEELCLLALEAGADDSITTKNLTGAYLRKQILLSGRRYRMEKELKHSKEQLMACIQNTPDVAVQWYNGQGQVLLWNKASERIFGWSAEEAIGRTVDELIAIPENKNFWLDKIQRMAAGEDFDVTKEWRFRCRNGQEGYCLSTLFSIPSFDNEPWFVCMDVDVTALKETQNHLRQSEERYQALFNQASDAIFINDTQGRFLDANEKASLLTGLAREEVLRRTVSDLYSKEELERRPIMWAELLRGERTQIERNLLRANGVEVPIEVTAQRLNDGRIMAIVRDISDRRKSKEALRKSEEQYRSLIEQHADAIAVFGKDGRIQDVNTSATQLLQYSREELQRMTLADVLSEEEMEENPVDFAALHAGDSIIKQRCMKRKDGTLVETEVNAKRLLDNLFLVSVRDLMERIEVQHRLEKEIDLSDSIINSLPGLFYLFQPGAGYLRWNKQLENTSGYTADEIRNMTPLDFFDADEKQKIAKAVDTVFSQGEDAVEANLLTKNGRKIPYYFTGRYIAYNGRPAFLGTGIDLSEVKKLERELSTQKMAAQRKVMQAMIEAEEKERNKLGLELHDNVNQILSVVRMYLSLLNAGEKMEEITLPKAMDLLNEAIREIRQLSHSLAISYKFEAGLAGTLEEMVDNVKLAKDFSVNLELPVGLDKRTNAQQKLAVYRIVQEALNNVIKYAKATEVEISIALTQQNLELEIADNGQGFLPSKANKGLGLSNMANRAEALGGAMVIDSSPGEGCGVKVRIPLKEE